jgi:hypothetical protein
MQSEIIDLVTHFKENNVLYTHYRKILEINLEFADPGILRVIET